MAKEAGLGLTVSVDDAAGSAQAIGNDITNLDWAMPSEVQDVTGVNASAIERIFLLADFSVTLHGVVNTAANMSHDVFKNVSATSVTRTVTITHSGQILGNETLFNDYTWVRAENGALTWSAAGELNSTTVPIWTT